MNCKFSSYGNYIKPTVLMLIVSMIVCKEIKAQPIAYINDSDGYTNVRKSPKVGSEILGKFFLGDEFYYFQSKDENWFNVSNHSISGYMYKSRVLPYQLKLNEVLELLKQFASINPNNAEFSQMFNEQMFTNLLNYPTAFLQAYCLLNNSEKEFIKIELQRPIHDGIDLELIIKKITFSLDPCDDAKEVIEAIQFVRKNMGVFVKPFSRVLNVPKWNNPEKSKFPLVINFTNEKVNGKNIAYYLNNPEIDFISKLIIQEKFAVTDDILTFSVMDSLFTKNESNRHFYFEIYKKIAVEADGALAEVIGLYYISLLRRYPCFFFEKVKNGLSDIEIQKLINHMAYEYYFDEKPKVKIKEDFMDAKLKCGDGSLNINELQSKIIEAVDKI